MDISPRNSRQWLLGLLSLFLSLGQIEASERIVVVNRDDCSVWFAGKPAPGEIKLPEGDVSIEFRAKPEGSDPVERFCFKLEGYDTEWRDFGGGADSVMRVAVVFYDRDGNWLSQRDFCVKGNSPGWTGSCDKSPLLAKSEVFAVPKGAATLSILLSSAGPPTEVGTLAVGALRISRARDKSGSPLWKLKFPEGEDARVPEGWGRSGSRPSMARVVSSKMAPAGRLLAIVDEDVSAHGEWQSPRIPVGAAAGELLRMDWLENFTAGVSGNHWLPYHRIEPGRHLFRFKKLTPQWLPTMEAEFALVVFPPFWQRTWFLVMSGMAVAGLTIGSIRYRSWQRARLEIAVLRQQNAIQAERARIARDLHDTLEQGLTGLSMQIRLTAKALEDGSQSKLRDSVDALRRLVKQCHSELRQSIWNLRSELDYIDLAGALSRMARSLAAGLNIQIEMRQDIRGVQLPSLVEDNLLRIAQESITNAIKNAGASRVTIDLAATPTLISLKISDNGRGFSGEIESHRKEGHFGIQGMEERTRSMGGQLTISSGNDGGCVIQVEVPLQKTEA